MSELDGLKLLRRIEEGVAGKTGDAFFRQIVMDLAGALGAHAAFAGQLGEERTASMLAFFVSDHFETCTTYKLDGTPCEYVYEGRITAYARDIGNVFPADREWFEQLGVNSYLGVPFQGETGEVFGHLAVMDVRERDWHEADVDVLRLFSLRSAAELERSRYQGQLEQANEELKREIDQRLEVEQQLTSARLAAEAANQAKSVFISNMSHELRTPLNGILGYVQILRKNTATLSGEQRKGLAVIERSGEHLLTLVNDLLDLAKIEAGRIEINPQDIDLNQLLSDVCELSRMRADRAGIDFHFESTRETAPFVRCDQRALRQILVNLVANAIKFTDPGGRVTLDVKYESSSDGRTLIEFRVSDSGIGIPANELDRIFEPFHRVEGRERTAEGMGLGLAITRQLVHEMRGDIQVSSRVGEGSTFTVRLGMDATAGVARHRILDDIIGYEGPRRTIFVVDDDAVGRAMVTEWLEDLGFEVHQACNGVEARDLLARRRPDALITDLVMPMLGGLELVRSLRADERQERLPVIALSASASSVTEAEALSSGCDAFLPKPLRLAALLEQLQHLLSLCWRVSAPHPGAGITVADINSELKLLDPEIASELLDLAMRGDVQAILDLANGVLKGHALCGAIRACAEQYDMRGIRDLLSTRQLF
jgi:signal transduction histidine kinase/DNA-binding NarL/FixJ family response regulator